MIAKRRVITKKTEETVTPLGRKARVPAIDNKICWVADALHGPIPISRIEKSLISTTIFNRLHNILQDSTVCFTFPSDRTSRFSHSLGCMRLAGEVFRNGVLNAGADDRTRFFDLVKQELLAVDKGDQLTHDRKHFLSGTSAVQELSCKELSDPYYASQLPARLQAEDEYAYLVVFQAVRLCALLHDVGHPPFSHVTENALGDIYELCARRTTPRKKDFYEKYSSFNPPVTKFHEWLSGRLAESLFDEAIKAHSLASNEYKYILIRIKHLTLDILASKSPFHKSLHDIVDGDLDVDRLDYVARDLVMSGFSKEPFRYERLIDSHQLVCPPKMKDGTENSTGFAILPSVRALSTIEDFFVRRFQLYKFVIYHHRVVKFDALLQRCVRSLATDYLNREEEPTTHSDFLLCNDISGLWQVLDKNTNDFSEKQINYYIQWDDAWLLSVLRREYLTIKAAREESHGVKTLSEIRLEELLSNKKFYFSLFKRGDSFREVDLAFVNALPDSFSFPKLKKKFPGQPSAALERLQKCARTLRGQSSKSNDDPQFGQAQTGGFFLVALFQLLDDLGRAGKRGMEFVAGAADDLKKREHLADAILIPKRIKPGVKSDLLLINRDSEVIHLGQVSRVASELRQAELFFPPFFLFLYREGDFESAELQKLRQTFGKLLANRFLSWTKWKP
jgi:HD superfamily phosphohydrolase